MRILEVLLIIAKLPREIMIKKIAITSLFAVALLVTIGTAQAFDELKYPDWKGQWRRADPGPPRYDPSKPLNAQQAPLTDEWRRRLSRRTRAQELVRVLEQVTV